MGHIKKRFYLLLTGGLVLLSIGIYLSGHFTVSAFSCEAEIEDTFDLLDDEWWINHVGYVSKKILNPDDPSDLLTGKLVMTEENQTFSNRYIRSSTAGPNGSTVVTVKGTNAFILNCILESACRVYTPPEVDSTGHLTIENCTFLDGKMTRNAISGMSATIRYNYITANNDGIELDGGLTRSSLIEYNWIKGPGYRVGDNHMDGIQLNNEGNCVIRYNKIGGFENACIMIGSSVKPRAGDLPTSNVQITGNYFYNDGLAYYYLYVREGDNSAPYKIRPRYITITDNLFAYTPENMKRPISTGPNPKMRAMFVRTEAEREEGVRRQEKYPEVLAYRVSLGHAESAADARTWIVWNNNRWTDDNRTEVPPEGGTWYDLEAERVLDH